MARTFVEAAPDGWWYTALLPDSTRLFAYHVDPSSTARLLRSSERWEWDLSATGYVGAFFKKRLIGSLRAADASGAVLDRSCGSGWMAIGDVALSFDPLSSQGIYTAMYSGMLAANTILAAPWTWRASHHGLRAYAVRTFIIGKRPTIPSPAGPKLHFGLGAGPAAPPTLGY